MRPVNLLVLGLGLATASSAFAQEGEPTDPAAPPPPAAPAPAATPGKGPFPRIADEEETIYAVQRKAYLVKKKFEITPLFSMSFTDNFIQTFAPAASVTYHAAENFGIELFGAYMFPTESGLRNEILDKGKLTPETAKLTQMLWAAGLGVQWSPIYGKIQIFGASLGNFAFYVGAGGAIGQSRVECTATQRLDPNKFPDANCPNPPADLPMDERLVLYEPASLKVMGTLSGGVRFYFSDWLGLKLEVKDYVFTSRVYRPEVSSTDQRFTDAVRNNIFVQIGVSFLFGGEE